MITALMAAMLASPAQAAETYWGVGGRWSTYWASNLAWQSNNIWSVTLPATMMCGGGDAFVAPNGFRIGAEGEYCGDLYSYARQDQWFVGGYLGKDVPLTAFFVGGRVGFGYGEYNNNDPGYDRYYAEYFYIRPAGHFSFPFGFGNLEIAAYGHFPILTAQKVNGASTNGGSLVGGGMSMTIHFGDFRRATMMGRAALRAKQNPPPKTPTASYPVAVPASQAPPAVAAPAGAPLAIPATGAGPAAVPAPAPPPPPAPATPGQHAVPVGSDVLVRLNTPVDAAKLMPGTKIAASLQAPIVASDGTMLAAANTAVFLTVAEQYHEGNKFITLTLTEIQLPSGFLVPVNADSAALSAGTGGKNAATGAVVGAIFGAVIGGATGYYGGAAVAGAAVGGMAGAAVGSASERPPQSIAAGTLLTYHLTTDLKFQFQ